MIIERPLYQAKKWNGELVTGVLLTFRDNADDIPDCVIIPTDETGTPEFNEDGYIEYGVNPDSVKPVRMKQIEVNHLHSRTIYKFPNCGGTVGKRSWFHYKCGQCLDWH